MYYNNNVNSLDFVFDYSFGNRYRNNKALLSYFHFLFHFLKTIAQKIHKLWGTKGWSDRRRERYRDGAVHRLGSTSSSSSPGNSCHSDGLLYHLQPPGVSPFLCLPGSSLLVVDEGSRACLCGGFLGASDLDSPPDLLTFHLEAPPLHGFLENTLPTPGSEKSNAGVAVGPSLCVGVCDLNSEPWTLIHSAAPPQNPSLLPTWPPALSTTSSQRAGGRSQRLTSCPLASVTGCTTQAPPPSTLSFSLPMTRSLRCTLTTLLYVNGEMKARWINDEWMMKGEWKKGLSMDDRWMDRWRN